MITDSATAWRWDVGTSAEEIHALLRLCDAYTATAEAPAPVRNMETTKRNVESGSVHVLRRGAEAVAMFTLTWEAPFEPEDAGFPPAQRPGYLQRLAVKPELLAEGSLVGARCIRRAIELARRAGADVIRSEANPDLARVVALLGLFGFEEFRRTQAEDGRRRVYLQKNLVPVSRRS